MATDPVRTIQHEESGRSHGAELRRALARLAALPPSREAPYLTLYLDWQPEGSSPGLRAARLFVEQERDRLLADHHAHTPPHESLAADFARIEAYLEDEADPSAHGLAIFACSAHDLFLPVPLPIPVPNQVITSVTPALLTLVKVVEDDPPYAALVLDQREASLLIIDQAARRESVEVHGSGYPRHQQQGGWSQRRYQNRADERIKAFISSVAEEVRRDLETDGVDELIVAGDEQNTALFADEAHQTVRDRIVGTIPLEIRSSEAEIIAATLPVARRAEREREAALIGRIENGAGPGGGAVHGPVETVTALQTGQVMTLAMNEDYTAKGWADFTLPLYGAGDLPRQHPGGGDPADLVPVALEEEIIRLALQASAAVEIIETDISTDGLADAAHLPDPDAPPPRTDAARRLDDLGGVGALLRYTLAEDQTTADL